MLTSTKDLSFKLDGLSIAEQNSLDDLPKILIILLIFNQIVKMSNKKFIMSIKLIFRKITIG